MAIVVRALAQQDRKGWEALWRGYMDFYETDLSADIDTLWGRLMEPPPEGPFALVAETAQGELVGLAQYLFHVTTWSNASRCYLNDLFTAPQARGQGVGRALIEAVDERAKAAGASQLWWLTQEFNDTARRLYDRLATVTPFVKYVR